MRLLLIEDEHAVAVGVARALRAEGFNVDIDSDGANGLAQARSVNYDLLILDIMLPTMNGYEICRELRNGGDWTPILILTAKSGEFDEAEGLELGADDYLTKPFSMVVLIARVGALLRRPRAHGELPFSAGDLRLDPARHRCWRGDDQIELTAREMEVLAFLVRRAGDVVSKLDLVDHVWGEDFRGNENIAEVYIRHLRRKIDQPYGRQTIRTVRGVGYQLRVNDGAE
jgi:two-component system OmpR family response regulator